MDSVPDGTVAASAAPVLPLGAGLAPAVTAAVGDEPLLASVAADAPAAASRQRTTAGATIHRNGFGMPFRTFRALLSGVFGRDFRGRPGKDFQGRPTTTTLQLV
jgi:hypothetical protein